MTKVLVVDDDFSTTNLLKMLLELEGFHVAAYSDATGALDELEDGVLAAIIDCYLGREATGIELLRAIRSHDDESVRQTPVIMVSGDHRLADVVIEEGADRFLLKPYSPRELTREIQALTTASA